HVSDRAAARIRATNNPAVATDALDGLQLVCAGAPQRLSPRASLFSSIQLSYRAQERRSGPGPTGGGGDHFKKNPKVHLSQPPCCAGASLSKVHIKLSINSSQFRAWSAGNMWWMNFGTADCTKNPLQIR